MGRQPTGYERGDYLARFARPFEQLAQGGLHSRYPRHRQFDIVGVMDPASLIRAVRRRRGLSQAEMARRAGTSQPVICAYENGRRDPTYTTLRKLIAAGGEELQLTAMVAASDLPRAVDDHEHAARLVDVLSLADAIPARHRSPVLNAPRLISR